MKRQLVGPMALALAAVLATGCSDTEKKITHVDPPKNPPGWDDSTLGLRFSAPGVGELFALATADLNGDGRDDIIFGGRGVAAVDPTGPTVLWIAKWDLEEDSSDNVWATGARVIPSATGGETPDILVGTASNELYLLRGADGTVGWRQSTRSDFYTTGIALVDADDDGIPDVFPTYGKAVHSGATGEELWSVELPHYATFVTEAELNGDAKGDLVVIVQKRGVIGLPEDEGDGDPEAGDPQVFGFASDGSLLFSAHMEGTAWEPVAVDLDGDGIQEVVVPNDLGQLYAFKADGSLLWQATYPVERAEYAAYGKAFAMDLDGDGVAEILVAGASYDEDRYLGLVYSSGGELTHTFYFKETVYAFATYDGKLFIGSGNEHLSHFHGTVSAFDLSADDPTKAVWEFETARAVKELALAHGTGEPELVVGMADAFVLALDPGTGAQNWSWTSGGFAFEIAAGDLDGDGIDEIVRGDEHGYVSAWTADGKHLWSWRPDVGNGGMITGIAIGDLDGNGGAEVVVTGARLTELEGGVVAVADGTGRQLWSQRLEGEAYNPQLVDLDGSGSNAIVFGEAAFDSCSVVAVDGNGDNLWSTKVGECIETLLATGDVDGDGLPEIGYAAVVMFTEPQVALLSGDGSILWQEAAADESGWVAVGDGAFFHGGKAAGAGGRGESQPRGHVTRRSTEDGSVLFQTLLEPSPAKDRPDPFEGTSRFATLVPDRDGDGEADLAVSSNNGAVTLLDGAKGETIWTTRLEPENLPPGKAHQAGPITFVPATDHNPAFLAVAQSNYVRTAARAFALDLDGEVVGEVDLFGEGHGIANVKTGQGIGAAVAAGLGVYLLEATAE